MIRNNNFGSSGAIKGGSTVGAYSVLARNRMGFVEYLNSAQNPIISYAFVMRAWWDSSISLYSNNPSERAEERGFILR